MSEVAKKGRFSKKIILNIKLILLLGLLVFLSAYTSVRNESRLLKSVSIQFENLEQPLISEETVNKLLIQNKGSIENIRKDALDLNRIESLLDTNPFVRNANVYVSVNGEVGVDVLQKTPLARVQTNESFYIDEVGKMMPTSPNFSVRVPLVTGKVDKKNLNDVYKVIKSISKDMFFKKEVEGLIVEGNKYTLLLREFDFLVDFGTSENTEIKLNNFKAFYKKAMKDKTLKKYKRVNLQITSQVICTKK